MAENSEHKNRRIKTSSRNRSSGSGGCLASSLRAPRRADGTMRLQLANSTWPPGARELLICEPNFCHVQSSGAAKSRVAIRS
jgi:hypothetical protein